MFTQKDAEHLLSRPEFKRFLYEVIQRAGLLSNDAGADGQSVRHHSLKWHEGRRSLGHEILQMAEEGQHDAMRSPDGLPIATLDAVLREAMNPKEKPDGRRRNRSDRDYNARYDELDRDD